MRYLPDSLLFEEFLLVGGEIADSWAFDDTSDIFFEVF